MGLPILTATSTSYGGHMDLATGRGDCLILYGSLSFALRKVTVFLRGQPGRRHFAVRWRIDWPEQGLALQTRTGQPASIGFGRLTVS